MNDLLCSVNGGKVALLTLLDLSAAFDTIDHGLLLLWLEFRNGIKGSVLSRFCFYIAEHCQHVKVNFEVSANIALQCGVPQGSMLGPILFTICTPQLGQIIDRYQNARQHSNWHMTRTKTLHVTRMEIQSRSQWRMWSIAAETSKPECWKTE